MDWSAIVLSLRLATATTLILLVVGLPLAGNLIELLGRTGINQHRARHFSRKFPRILADKETSKRMARQNQWPLDASLIKQRM